MHARVLGLGCASICFGASTLILLLGAQPIAAAEPAATITSSAAAVGRRSTPLLVIRLSDEALQSLLVREIDEKLAVEEEILGVPVSGTAHVEGRPDVSLAESSERATIDLMLKGTAVSRTVGQSGSVAVRSRSETEFTARVPIVLEPGKGFERLPVEVEAATQCFTEGVDSARRGVIGRVVQRRAARKVEANRPRTTEIAKERAELRIRQAVERRLEARLARLNGLLSAANIVAGKTNGEPPNYTCCSRPGCLEISLGRAATDAHAPIAMAAPQSPPAPIEVWLHKSLLGDRLAGALARYTGRPPAAEFLTDVAMPAVSQRPAPGAAIVKLMRVGGLEWQTEREWVVLRWQSHAAEDGDVSFQPQ